MLRYRSSRGRAPDLSFPEVLLRGLAPDGGLYLPERWPTLTDADPDDYATLAAEVMWPYVEETVGEADFSAMVAAAYSTFDHPDVCPIIELDDHHYLLELFHGPTLAFKDIALQLVGRLFDHELTRRDQRVMIVGATSGDTGSAAMEAVRDREHVDIVMLFPHGRTSDIQRRQMTTMTAANVHAVAIEGTFDDCQDLVKSMFADDSFRERNRLSAVNSINWARVMAQIVYYVWAAQKLGRRDAPTTFCVPTGNFGNVFAGHVASRMGLPVDRLLVASNRNDILTRLIDTGEMVADEVIPTLSPSMDIQISSNLERLLVELLDGNGPATAELLQQFRTTGSAKLSERQHERLRAGFVGARLDDDETLAVIADVNARHGLLVDPHTAVAIGAAERLRRRGETVVTLATAHPAKFPDAVEAATGTRPELPAQLAGILDPEEQFEVLRNELGVVEDYVDSVSR